MKKSTKLLKRFAALFLVVLMSIDGFAAVVSDNDGSAFITKAEFESLKSTFQQQLAGFNSGIDGKIDDAIVTYVTGIKQSSTTKSRIINADWEEVSNVNGAFPQEYIIPEVDLQFFLNSWISQMAVTQAQWQASFYVYILFHYMSRKTTIDWNTAKHCYRNCVWTKGTPPATTKVIWDGRAIRYHETWTLSRLARLHGTSGGSWPWLDRPFDVTYTVEVRNFTSLQSAGLVTNWDDVKNSVWPISYYWSYKAIPGAGGATGTSNVAMSSMKATDNYQTVITLDPDDEGNTKEYEHIITYKTNDNWRVCNPSWQNYITVSPDQTLKSSNLESASAKNSWARVLGIAHHVNPHQGKAGDIASAHNITNDSLIPSLGLFTSYRTSNVIYQDDVEGYVSSGVKNIAKASPTLPQGFQLVAADKDMQIEWEPTFSYTHVHNSASTYQDNGHEVDIYFSNGPFTDGTTTTKPIRVKVNGGTTLQNYARTTSRKVKVNFDMPADGVVYVKWVPANAGTYLNSDWIVTLDLENCNTYKWTVTG